MVVFDTRSGKQLRVPLTSEGGEDDGLYGGGTPQISKFDWHPLDTVLFIKLKGEPGIRRV